MPVTPEEPILTILGIKLGTALAGLFGGMARAFLMPNVTKTQAVGCCIVGAFTAGYMTPVAMYWLPFASVSGADYAVAYALGLSGMLVSEGILNLVARWRDNPTLPPRDPE